MGTSRCVNTGPGCFFFVVAPFCSCPASLVSRKFFAVGPGCAKCFFLLRSVGRRDLLAGPEQKKKNTTQGAFFFCCGPGERQGKEKPRWKPARGQSKNKKKHHPGCFFFAAAPRGRSRTHGGLGRFRQGPGGVFFCLLRPRRVFLDNSKKCLGYYIGSKKTRRGHSKKKTPLPIHASPSPVRQERLWSKTCGAPKRPPHADSAAESLYAEHWTP